MSLYLLPGQTLPFPMKVMTALILICRVTNKNFWKLFIRLIRTSYCCCRLVRPWQSIGLRSMFRLLSKPGTVGRHKEKRLLMFCMEIIILPVNWLLLGIMRWVIYLTVCSIMIFAMQNILICIMTRLRFIHLDMVWVIPHSNIKNWILARAGSRQERSWLLVRTLPIRASMPVRKSFSYMLM